MKEHVQKPGVRKWAGEDLIELQGESLTAIQALVEPYAPCIIQGCEVSQANGVYQVQPGIVALKGSNEDGNACTKIVRFEGYTGTVMPIYLTIKVTPYMRVYADEENKPIAYEYTAESSTTQPAVPYLMIKASGAERLVDTIGITQKLDREGGNASNVKVVSFVSDTSNDRSNIEAGSSLKELFGKIRRWFNDLGKLAFKNTVGESDFDTTLTEAFNNKVDKDGDKVLSECDFTQFEKDKLSLIAEGANKYTHPSSVLWSKGSGLYKITVNSNGHVTAATLVTKADITALGIPGQDTDTVYTHPNSAAGAKAAGLYKISTDAQGHIKDVTEVTKEDITALGIPGQDTNTVYTHPTTAGNKHIPSGGSSGQYLKYSASGTAQWAKPTASEIGAADSSHSHNNATQSAAGFMSADDKKKLDDFRGFEICVSTSASDYIRQGGRGGKRKTSNPVVFLLLHNAEGFYCQICVGNTEADVTMESFTGYAHNRIILTKCGLYVNLINDHGAWPQYKYFTLYKKGSSTDTKNYYGYIEVDEWENIENFDLSFLKGVLHATTTADGLMEAADKKKLDKIGDVGISINGDTLRFTWGKPTSGMTASMGYYYYEVKGTWNNGL